MRGRVVEIRYAELEIRLSIDIQIKLMIIRPGVGSIRDDDRARYRLIEHKQS